MKSRRKHGFQFMTILYFMIVSAFGRRQGSRRKHPSEPAIESGKSCPAVTTQVVSYAMVTS